MTTEEALFIALRALRYADMIGLGSVNKTKEAIKVLTAIGSQGGCEHFDKACTDGKLTSLIDIIVFG